MGGPKSSDIMLLSLLASFPEGSHKGILSLKDPDV